MPLASSFYTVSERVNGKWQAVSDSNGAYSFSSTSDRIRIEFSADAFLGTGFIMKIAPAYMSVLGTPRIYRYDVDSPNASDHWQNTGIDIPWSELCTDFDQGFYGLCFTYSNLESALLRLECDKTGYLRISDSFFMDITNMPSNTYYGRIRVDGVFDSNDNKVYAEYMSSPVLSISSGGNTKYYSRPGFPTLTIRTDARYAFRFAGTDGILKSGYEYKFQFKIRCHDAITKYFTLGYNGSWLTLGDEYSVKVISSSNTSYQSTDYIVLYTLKPDFDMDLNLVSFGYDETEQSSRRLTYFKYLTSSSSYFPASDTGGMQQNINNVVTQISTTVQNISNTVNNISTQITNAVTNITNAVKDQTNELKQNDDKNTSQITQNATENADKVIDNAKENTDKVIENAKENTQQIDDAIEEHGNFIIEGLKSLFIPSDDFFDTYITDLRTFFEEKLGFLYTPIDVFLQLCDLFINAGNSDATLTLPGFSIMGETVWEEQVFDLGAFLNTNFGELLTAIRTGTSALIVFGFLRLLYQKSREVIGYDSGSGS